MVALGKSKRETAKLEAKDDYIRTDYLKNQSQPAAPGSL
jgi:hypothetical protein